MAGDLAILWRNYDSSDQTKNNSYRIGQHIPTLDTLGWSSPTGKSFKEWNTSKDGTGTAYQPGDQIPTSLYAIWSDESYKKLINLSLLNCFLENLNTLLESIQAAIEAKIPAKYAASESAGGPATVTNGIHYAQVDGSSTATVFTASIDGITEYYDGLTVLLKNGVITSASGFTVNINGLGAKPVYSNMSAATRETTTFNVNYTLLLIYDSTRVTGGCWINYRGYYSDTNTVPTGYCTTAAGTAAKSATCTYGYRDDDNYFPCVFRYANIAANATLAISSYATTAAPIYVNGARTSSSNTFGRGVILFLYHNDAYYCYNDGRFPIVVDGAVTSVQEYVNQKTSAVLPAVTSSDNGKILRVVDGAWAAASLPNANGVSF